MPGFNALILRRETTQVRQQGGLWDQSIEVYAAAGGTPRSQFLDWTFQAETPEGITGKASVKFGGIEHDSSLLAHDGASICYIGWDELTAFTRRMFFYLFARNRSTCGVRPYIRATCNPDPDSWVAEFIAWWIDQDTGYPIEERSGKLRWFVLIDDQLQWADTRQELLDRFPPSPETPRMPVSVTFIPSKVYDNQELLKRNPEYLAKLLALPRVERERLLGGNWKIRPSAGLYFKRSWCTVIKPADLPPLSKIVRGWDLAATEKTSSNDPDWTVGHKLGRDDQGRYYVLNHIRFQGTPAAVEGLVRTTAIADTAAVEIGIPQDPGQAGKFQASYMTRALDGFAVRTTPEQGDKISRFGPYSSQAQVGNIFIIEGPWNDEFFRQLEGFPDLKHDDDADACSRAFQLFHDATTGLLDYYKAEAAKLRQVALRPSAKLVKMKPADPTKVPTHIYGSDGSRYMIEADGTVAVNPADVAPLQRHGFIPI